MGVASHFEELAGQTLMAGTSELFPVEALEL
jgi:hypothetical protein